MAYLLRRLWHSIPNALQSVINGILSVCIPETEEEVATYSLFIPSGSDSLITFDGDTFKVRG